MCILNKICIVSAVAVAVSKSVTSGIDSGSSVAQAMVSPGAAYIVAGIAPNAA